MRHALLAVHAPCLDLDSDLKVISPKMRKHRCDIVRNVAIKLLIIYARCSLRNCWLYER